MIFVYETSNFQSLICKYNYTANFYADNENVLEEIKKNHAAHPAAEFQQGPTNSEILLIPFYIRQRDA